MDYKSEYLAWLNSPVLSEAEHQELVDIQNDEKEIESRFYSPLEFGTAGLRGTMGMGLHRMNVYTVKQVTQGIAELVSELGEDARKRGVAVCYDCRHNSDIFAREVACVLAANNVHAYLFDALHPTPELSFAIRHYKCQAGINVTASHNPKEYNGYKVYWQDGAQLPPKEADVVAKKALATDIFTGAKTTDYDAAVKSGMITLIGKETDEAFLEAVLKTSVNPDYVKQVADDMKLVYTPFHGTGYKLVPEILRRIGYKNIICVPEQMVIDGDFPTVKSPNPENPEGFALAIELAKKNDVDLIVGTDPDADRIGILSRNPQGEYIPLTGNQVGVLLLDYIITAKKEKGILPKNAAAVKSIVTTELARKICEQNGVACFDTFTGFKFMAERVKMFEQAHDYQYIFAYEESYGYMCGDHTRDKDAVTATMLVGEMAAYYRLKGMTLIDATNALYEKYGFYSEKTINLVMPGLDGLQKMKAIMEKVRTNPPTVIGGLKVEKMIDYLTGEVKGEKAAAGEKAHISGSNVLYFYLENDNRFVVRPSGTEPKIKIYALARGNNLKESLHMADVLAEASKELTAI